MEEVGSCLIQEEVGPGLFQFGTNIWPILVPLTPLPGVGVGPIQ